MHLSLWQPQGFLAEGIPPKILPKLKESIFLQGLWIREGFKDLLEEIPIFVNLDDKASLKGADTIADKLFNSPP